MNRNTALCMMAAMTFSSTSTTYSQGVQYEVLDIGSLGGGESSARGINSKHQVTGFSNLPSVTASASPVKHAILWLACPDYGLSAETLVDLSSLAGFTTQGHAHAINDFGFVVGDQVTAVSAGHAHPLVWRLDTLGLAETREIMPLATSPQSYGVGYGVTNEAVPTIVGEAEIDSPFGGCPLSRGFAYWYGDPVTARYSLGVNVPNLRSGARGIAAITNSALAVGYSSYGCSNTSCDNTEFAIAWNPPTPAGLVALTDYGAQYGAEANGVDPAAGIVGDVMAPAFPCELHAAWWPMPTAAPVDLATIPGATIAPGDSRAFAIHASGTNELRIVGRNDTANAAWYWYQAPNSQWHSIDLNTTISPLCNWILHYAYGVTADGWIVGDGLHYGEHRGFILRPITCIGDLNHDCVVDGADLGLLLEGWVCANDCAGGCPMCPACIADLNRDEQVNGVDLAVVLGHWGACECTACPELIVDGRTDLRQRFIDALESSARALGFATVNELARWGRTATEEMLESASNSLLILARHYLGDEAH